MVHDRPGRGDGPARPGPGHARRGVNAARPVAFHKELGPSQITVPVKDDRRPLGRIGVLVQIDRDRGHAGHGEIEVWDLVSQLSDKRQHETAHTCIHVAQRAVFSR